MSEIETAALSRDEARSLTDEVRGDAERLWRKLVELYEGKAHVALEYRSWGAYFKAEFGGSERRSYQLLEAGRVMDELAPVKNFALPANEDQARALAPLLKQPETLREAWAEVVETVESPTAADVREVVTRRTQPNAAPRTAIPAAVRALQALYEATRETPVEEVIGWRGNSRQLAMQWACVQDYILSAFAARGDHIPRVLKGEIQDG